ncbi:MAG: TrmB family transcriptional regulator [Candidatus Odinarchaeia archaeon]
MKAFSSDLIRSLRRIGLTEYEAEVYLALLSLGSATASDISKKCRVPISKIYEVIRSLIKRELIEVQPTRPKKFRPLDPDKTITPQIKLIKNELDSLTKEIRTYYQNPLKANAPDVFWLFNGKKELKHKTEELIRKAREELLIIAQEIHYINLDLIKLLPRNINLRIAANVDPNSKIHKSIVSYLREFGAHLKIYTKKDLWVIGVDSDEILIATPSSASDMTGIYISKNVFSKIFRKIFNKFWDSLEVLNTF